MSQHDDVARRARYFERNTRDLLKRLQVERNGCAHEEWMRATSMAQVDEVVVGLAPERYSLPTVAAKFLSPQSLAQLRGILADVKAVNDDLAGLRVNVARQMLGGDERVSDIVGRTRIWAEDYVKARLLKRSVRQLDADPLAKYERIVQEFVPLLEKFASTPASIHGTLLFEMCDYIPWLVFQGTWAERLLTLPQSDPLRPAHGLKVEPEFLDPCAAEVDLYGWGRVHDVDRALTVMRQGLSSMDRSVGSPRVLLELRQIAFDLVEMRPFLLYTSRAKNVIVEIAPDFFVTWLWGGGESLGWISVATSRRQALEQARTEKFVVMLRVNYRGVLSSRVAAWRDSAAALGEDGLRLNLVLLDRIRERLFGAYLKAEGGLRGPPRVPSPTSDPSELAVALACTAITADEPVTAHDKPVQSPTASREIRGIRFERFRACLDRLGCKVTQAKGSEVKFYRPGGRIAVVGHHTRNGEVSHVLVRKVLVRLGIPFRDFLEATTSNRFVRSH